MQRALIVVGILVLVIGLLWPWVSQLPFGRLPGDIVVSKPGFRFFFPITTMILLSIVVSAILWFFRH
ncbi:MAG TPA: DUF2905 domain-containing protein [Woeseiaceae bacterium]|jgi:hypothetical protein|nr:DUF2905 domain-containing protein [Woeseiaceae bacterium]